MEAIGAVSEKIARVYVALPRTAADRPSRAVTIRANHPYLMPARDDRGAARLTRTRPFGISAERVHPLHGSSGPPTEQVGARRRSGHGAVVEQRS